MRKRYIKKFITLATLAALTLSSVGSGFSSIAHATEKADSIDKVLGSKDAKEVKDKDSKEDKKSKKEEKTQGPIAEDTSASDGSAMGRISTYISFANGKKLDPKLLKNLNTEQLRFLGIFMSNFYTPWMTDFGSNTEESDKIQQNISNALKDYAKFDKVTAETFASELQGLARGNTVGTLRIKFTKKQSSRKFVDLEGSSFTNKSATYADLLLLASGYLYENRDLQEYKDITGNAKLGSSKYRYFALGYSRSNNSSDFTPIFMGDTRGTDNTASMIAYMKAMEMVDTSKGYGFAALDFKNGEIELSKESFSDMLSTIGDKHLAGSSIYGAKLGVSGFGDLLWLGKNHQYVILPASMNPFVWQRLDDSGTDYGKAGNALNLASVQMMAHMQNGGIGNVKQGSSRRLSNYYLTPNPSDPFGDMPAAFNSGGSQLYDLRLVLGNEATTATIEDWLDWVRLGFNTTEVDELSNVIKSEYIASRKLELSKFVDTEMLMPKLSTGSDSVNVMGGIVLIDDLGAFGSSSDTGDSSKDSYGGTDDYDKLFRTLQKGSIIADGGGINTELLAGAGGSGLPADAVNLGEEGSDVASNGGSVTWGNSYSEITKGQGIAKFDVNEQSQKIWKELYATYLVATLNKGRLANGEHIGYRLNIEGLPHIDPKAIVLSDSAKTDVVTKAIRDWLYYLLNPNDGFDYFSTLVSNKTRALLLKSHNDLVGTEGVGVLPGTTRYIGFSGYVTTPELEDLEWTDAMLKWYESIIIYLIIFMFALMAGYYILGMLSIQKAMLGVVILSLLAYTPIYITSWSASISNRFANIVFGDKFTYWGIVQQQAYFADLGNSIREDTYSNYLLSRYNENALQSKNQGGDNIVLRWQAPKKMSSLVLSKAEESAYSDDFTQMINVVLEAQDNSQTFTDSASSSYFYRSYTDLANVSMFMYGDYVSNGQTRGDVDSKINKSNVSKWSSGMSNSWKTFDEVYVSDRELGYSVPDGAGSIDSSQAYRIRLPLAGNIYSDASSPDKIGKVSNLVLGQYLGIDQRMFNFTLAQLNTNQNLVSELAADGFDPSQGGKYNNADIKSLAAYGIMSENPFYYFSWGLYDQGLSSNPWASGGFRDLLLSKSNSGYFYNTENNNELRDFLDFRTMFTYLIPYLKQGNDVVKEWDDTYGVFFYDGVTYEEGHENDEDIASNPELAQKYWHNVNVARLYNIYTPWVDLMYETDYAKQEKVRFQGETYTILDPINPASYPAERPMVFSRSEMYDFGLTDSQLTKVERKLVKISEEVMERWFYLLNYYNFTDAALNTSAAMEATFVFNQEFSEFNLLGRSINIYPQSFELKNFTYDAFLRMIISNSTGESLVADEGQHGSVYERIMERSSAFTGIFLVLLDILANYLIPLVKITTLVGLFISLVIAVILTAMSVNEDIGKRTIKKIRGAIISPAFQYVLTSILMSFFVSKFMGNGNVSVTGYSGKSIVLGDPFMTILAMVGLNALVFAMYSFVAYKVYLVLKDYGGLVVNQVTGVVGGIASLTLSRATGGKFGSNGGSQPSGVSMEESSGSSSSFKKPESSEEYFERKRSRALERAERKALERKERAERKKNKSKR